MTRPRATRAIGRVSLRGVMVFTLPVITLGLYLFASTALDYQRIQQFDDWNSRTKHVDRLGFNRIRAAWRAPRAWELEQRFSAEDRTRPLLRLFVDQGLFDAVGSDLLGRWGTEMPAQVDEHGQLQDVTLKLRGDTSVHWTTTKKSLSLKADRGRMFKGYRQLAFSAKDVVPAYFANSLPADFEIPGADTAIVPIFLNDRFYGLFRFTELLDETFLRRHTLLPGNVFRGDAAERGEYFKNQERELFRNLYIWDRAARNDRPGSVGTATLGEWLAVLNGSTYAEFRRCMAWLDRDELSRMLALLLACGDPFHMSGVHNQFWYEDPSSGLLHQIPWDIRLLDLERPPQGSNFNRGLVTFLRDPRVFDGALAELWSQLDNDRLLTAARARIDELERNLGDMLEYEHWREGLIPDVGSPAACLAIFESNLRTLAGWIADARVAFHAEPAEAQGARVLDFESRGYAAAELVALANDGPFELYADSNLDGSWSEADRRVPGAFSNGEFRLDAPEVLLPGVHASTPHLVPEPIAYRYFAHGASGPLAPSLRNRHDGRDVAASAWPRGSSISSGASWHPWLEPEAAPRTLEFSGETRLDQTLIVDADTSLTIHPGTKLVLGPDVSIVAKGRVSAKGTREAPITVVNAEPQKPWGSFALQGPAASGSELEWIEFRGGGGGLPERVEYTGMVCVHNAKDVYFRNCHFDSNLRCDDMVHADLADLYLVDCSFQDANGDAIDYDMSGGEVRGCTIDRSRNDGCDFMTCWPRVIGCTITRSGDKGISVGEASRPLIFGNTIEGCLRGVEIKDSSEPVIAHNTIRGCQTGLRARLKNWRYGYGGWPKVVNTLVVDNGTVLDFEERTHLTALGTQLDRSDEVLASADAAWLLARFGIRAATDRLGPLASFEDVAPIEPLFAVEFEDDFGPPTAGWRHSGGVRRVDKRVEGLVATFRRERGELGTQIDWRLDAPDKRYVLALELATERMRSAELVLTRADGGEARLALDTAHDSKRFQFAVLDLPAGEYRALRLRGDPDPARRDGTPMLCLHRYEVMALDRAP